MKATTLAWTLAAVMALSESASQALTIETVPVGNPGNEGEVQSQGTFGAVSYAYRIGKFEVTNNQYTEFLNAVAATDTHGLYSSLMGSEAGGGGRKNITTVECRANVILHK